MLLQKQNSSQLLVNAHVSIKQAYQQEELEKKEIQNELEQISILDQEKMFFNYSVKKMNEMMYEIQNLNEKLVMYCQISKLSIFHFLIVIIKLMNILYIVIYIFTQMFPNYHDSFVVVKVNQISYCVKKDQVDNFDVMHCTKCSDLRELGFPISFYIFVGIYFAHKLFYAVNQIIYFYQIFKVKYICRIKKYDILFSDYFASNIEFIINGIIMSYLYAYQYHDETCYNNTNATGFGVDFLFYVYYLGFSVLSLILFIFVSKLKVFQKYPILLSYLVVLTTLFFLLYSLLQFIKSLIKKGNCFKILDIIWIGLITLLNVPYVYFSLMYMFYFGDIVFIVHNYVVCILILISSIVFYGGINYDEQIDFLASTCQIVELKNFLIEKQGVRLEGDDPIIQQCKDLKQYGSLWESFQYQTKILKNIQIQNQQSTQKQDEALKNQYSSDTILRSIITFRKFNKKTYYFLNLINDAYYKNNFINNKKKSNKSTNDLQISNQQDQITSFHT